MAVTGFWYPYGMAHLAAGKTSVINWTADSASLMCALMNTAWSATSNQGQTSKEFWSDVSAFEVAAGGTPTNYTAKGKLLGATTFTVGTIDSKTVGLKTTSATNLVWTVPTLSTAGAVIFKDTGTAGTSPLVAFLDWGGAQSPAAGDFTITWDTGGIGKITVS